MTTKTTLAAIFTASALAAGAANANTITVTAFSITDWTNAVSQMGTSVIEDFETLGPTIGEGSIGNSLSTAVGTFDTTGGTGGGTTCSASLAASGSAATGCTSLSLFGPDLNGTNGQGNLVPDDGKWSLNADDTTGIIWDVALAGGALFNQVIFGLRDAADVRAKVDVTAGGETVTFESLANANAQLIVVDFANFQTGATIRIENQNNVVNDSFSLDGAAVNVVPLPAAAWMLLAGIGGLFGMRRLRKAA